MTAVPVLYSVRCHPPSTRLALPVAFAGLAPPSRWPRPRSAPRPDVLEAGVETLPRVGPAVRNRLAKLGLRTRRRPALPPPAPLRAPDRRAVDQRSLRRRRGRDPGSRARHLVAPRPRPAEDPQRPRRGRHRRDQGDVVQPALARGAADARHEGQAARQAEPLRLPGRELRPRRGDRDGRLRAGLPRQRGAGPEAAPRARRGRARARPRRRRCAARVARRLRAAAAAGRCARRDAPPALAGGGRGGPAAARLRRAPRPPARARAPDGGARAARRGGASSGRRAPRPVPRGAPVHAHRRAGAGDCRDRPRSGAHDADAAAAPGRRRLRQDRRRARDAAAGRRGGTRRVR